MSYATLEQFYFRVKPTGTPTAEYDAAAQQALDAASEAITTYLGWDELETPPVPTSDQEALLAIVNLDVAQEFFRAPLFGAVSQGAELAPVIVARDSFERHRRKLAPLKTSWGIA